MHSIQNSKEIKVVKIGGNIVDNPEALASFLIDFKNLEGKKVLVHGGGVMASKMAIDLGIKTTMMDAMLSVFLEQMRIVFLQQNDQLVL